MHHRPRRTGRRTGPARRFPRTYPTTAARSGSRHPPARRHPPVATNREGRSTPFRMHEGERNTRLAAHELGVDLGLIRSRSTRRDPSRSLRHGSSFPATIRATERERCAGRHRTAAVRPPRGATPPDPVFILRTRRSEYERDPRVVDVPCSPAAVTLAAVARRRRDRQPRAAWRC